LTFLRLIFLALQFIKIVGEAVKALIPEALIRLHPVVDGFEPITRQGVPALLPLGPDRDQTDLLEDRQVLGGLGLGEAQQPGDVIDRALALGDQVKDLPPARFRDRVEGIGGCW
jgi:hypothetical protein